MSATPIPLSDVELDSIFAAAQPIAPDRRDAFIQRVAHALQDCHELGPGHVYRAIRDAQKALCDYPNLTAWAEGEAGSTARRCPVPYWTAARLESNRERIALLMLAQAKFVVYAPRLRAWRVVRGRRQAREIALFPGYCFVEIALQWHPVCQCPGVIKLVMDGLQPARVPDKVIAEIRARERDGAIDLAPPAPQYRPGDEVRVVQGPFSGHAALFAGLGGHARVAVLLNLLGGSQRAKLPADAIEPIVQAAPALNGNVGNAPHVGDPRARHRARRERQRLRRQSGGGAADCFGHGSSIRRSALCP